MDTDNKGHSAFLGFHPSGDVLVVGFDPCLSVSIRGFRISTAGFRLIFCLAGALLAAQGGKKSQNQGAKNILLNSAVEIEKPRMYTDAHG